jgi:hypothetical protein
MHIKQHEREWTLPTGDDGLVDSSVTVRLGLYHVPYKEKEWEVQVDIIPSRGAPSLDHPAIIHLSDILTFWIKNELNKRKLDLALHHNPKDPQITSFHPRYNGSSLEVIMNPPKHRRLPKYRQASEAEIRDFYADLGSKIDEMAPRIQRMFDNDPSHPLNLYTDTPFAHRIYEATPHEPRPADHASRARKTEKKDSGKEHHDLSQAIKVRR